MARGRRSSVEEQLMKVNSDIEETEAKLKALKESKKNLEKEMKSRQIEELAGIIETSGMSIEDVKNILASKKK